MSQQEMEKEIKGLKDRLTEEVGKISAMCQDLGGQLAAVRKRVRQIEVDYYKDLEEDEAQER